MEKNSSTQVAGSTRRIVMAGLAVLAIGVSGCGLVKTGYRNGDTVGLFMMNRYLDLSSEQKEYVKPKLRALLAWHRSTQLPDYTTLAVDLQKRAPQPITAADVTSIGEQSKRRAYTTVHHAIPDMADIALRLTPDNIKALQDKFADDDATFRKENLKGDADRQKKVRYEKTLDRVEEWYGSFSREQKTQIRQLSDARPLDNDALLAERQRRENDIVQMLVRIERDKPSRDAAMSMMRAVSDRFEQSPEPQRRAFMETFHRATDEMNAGIHNLATAQQREHAVAKLQEWIDDFRTLSAAAAS